MDDRKTVYEQPECYTKTGSYKPVCYKNRPAVMLSKSTPEQPTFVAAVMYFINEDNILKPCTEMVFDPTQITDYYCPHADKAPVPMAFCDDNGKCMHPVTPGTLPSMCLSCIADSMKEFLRSENEEE